MLDLVLERAREGQGRLRESIGAVIYMDAVFLKIGTEGHVRNVAFYTIIRINLEGQKECLGLRICEPESAKHWLSVLNELKNRGIGDVLIFSVDNSRESPRRSRRFIPGPKFKNGSFIRSATPCAM